MALKKIAICFLLIAVISVSAFPVQTRANTAANVLENDAVMLTVNPETLAVDVVDKSNGYTWSSDKGISTEEGFNKSWTNRVNAGVTLEYYDTESKRINTTTILEKDTQITLSNNNGGLEANVDMRGLGIGFTLRFSLNGNELAVELPGSSINESGNQLKSVTLFSFFGAADADAKDGYILIPDGSGALIEYGKNTTKVTTPYRDRVYGANIAMNDLTNDTCQIVVPVYGIVHQDNAFYAEAESGASYADIFAYVPGVVLDKYWSGYTFNYRQNYFQPTGQDGSGYTTLEEKLTEYDLRVNYTFLSGSQADYIGMARDYQSKLVDRGMLTPKTGSDSYVRLDILGAERLKTFFGYKVQTYTTVDEAQQILNELIGDGVTPTVNYLGYTKGGLSLFPLSKGSFESKLGSSGAFDNFISFCANNGAALYFGANYATVNYNAVTFNKAANFIRKVDQKLLKNQFVYSSYSLALSIPNYAKMVSQWTKDSSFFAKHNMNVSVSMRAVPTDHNMMLFSDYGETNREQAITLLNNLFGGTSIKTAFHQPNAFLWGSTADYFDIYTSSTRYSMTTRDVPFLQIILKGYIDYFSSDLNSAGDPAAQMLKNIEYGAYPSYTVTWETPQTLLDTMNNHIFSSEFVVWKNKIIEAAKTAESVLKPVAGATITAHQSEGGLAVVTYDNGKQVLVNYNNWPVSYADTTVAAKTAVVVEGVRP